MLFCIKKAVQLKAGIFLFNAFFELKQELLILQKQKVQFFQTGLAPVFTITLFPSKSCCRLIFCFVLVLLAVDGYGFLDVTISHRICFIGKLLQGTGNEITPSLIFVS